MYKRPKRPHLRHEKAWMGGWNGYFGYILVYSCDSSLSILFYGMIVIVL